MGDREERVREWEAEMERRNQVAGAESRRVGAESGWGRVGQGGAGIGIGRARTRQGGWE